MRARLGRLVAEWSAYGGGSGKGADRSISCYGLTLSRWRPIVHWRRVRLRLLGPAAPWAPGGPGPSGAASGTAAGRAGVGGARPDQQRRGLQQRSQAQKAKTLQGYSRRPGRVSGRAHSNTLSRGVRQQLSRVHVIEKFWVIRDLEPPSTYRGYLGSQKNELHGIFKDGF